MPPPQTTRNFCIKILSKTNLPDNVENYPYSNGSLSKIRLFDSLDWINGGLRIDRDVVMERAKEARILGASFAKAFSIIS